MKSVADLIPGTKIKVILPKIIPFWIQEFRPWWDDIQSVNHQNVTIRLAPQTGSQIWGNDGQSSTNRLLFVFIEEHPSALFVEWLEDIKMICNCETSTLLVRGCQ